MKNLTDLFKTLGQTTDVARPVARFLEDNAKTRRERDIMYRALVEIAHMDGLAAGRAKLALEAAERA